MTGPTFRVQASQITRGQAADSQVFSGTQREAQSLLVDMANRFVDDRNRIVKGNFRLVMDNDGSAVIKARRFWHSASNDQANRFIKSLVRTAYGEPAANAVTQYLGNRNKLGSHSFIKLVKGWRAQQVPEEQLTLRVDGANVKQGARLSDNFLTSPDLIGPASDIPIPQVRSDDNRQVEGGPRPPVSRPPPPINPDNKPAPPPVAENPKPAVLNIPQGVRYPSLYRREQISFDRELGSGNFGTAHEVSVAGEPGFVLKELAKPAPLSLASFEKIRGKQYAFRGDGLQESLAVYLSSSKHSDWSKDLNVSAPTHFLIRQSENAPVQLLTVQETHQLLKNARAAGVNLHCVGQVMKKAPGESLSALMDEGSLTEADHKQIARSMLTTLRKLAERGFIHRDIKPDNLFYDRQTGTVTFIDTGFLYKMPKPPSGHHQLVSPNYVMGTPDYMSPLVWGFHRYGANVDLHSTAMTLLEMAYPTLIFAAQGYLRAFKNSSDAPEKFIDTLSDAVEWVRGDAEERFEVVEDIYDNADKRLKGSSVPSPKLARSYREALLVALGIVQKRKDAAAEHRLKAAINLLRVPLDPTKPRDLARLNQAHSEVRGLLNMYADRVAQADQFKEDENNRAGSVVQFAIDWLYDANKRQSPWLTRESTVAHFEQLLQELDPQPARAAV